MTEPGWSGRSDARRLQGRGSRPAPAVGSTPRATRTGGSRSAKVAVPALAAFFALFGGLALQMREGGDPALGAGSPATRKHTVLVRRTVITHVVPATGAGTAATGSSSGSDSSVPAASAGSSGAAPPATTPAPTPAPTVVTRQS